MASQWTPKLVTWRIKDWASCFLASKIPIDGVDNKENSSNNNNLTFKKIIKRKRKGTKKKRSERKHSLSPPGTRHFHLRSSSVSPTSTSQHRPLSLPQTPTSDEPDFIVFCFDREDGSFDVVKQEKKEELSLEKSPRTVHRKLIFGDQGILVAEKSSTSMINGTDQEQKDNTSYQETEDVYFDVHEKNDEEEDEEIDASDKSSSDEGRGSFAFPILGIEWMGSPVQMPKSDDLSPKKQKHVALRFQCCRF